MGGEMKAKLMIAASSGAGMAILFAVDAYAKLRGG